VIDAQTFLAFKGFLVLLVSFKNIPTKTNRVLQTV